MTNKRHLYGAFSRSPNKGEQIRSGFIKPALSGYPERSIWLHHPAFLGVLMVRIDQTGYITPAFSFLGAKENTQKNQSILRKNTSGDLFHKP